MINLHEIMGPGRDRTRDPWICIYCQTLSDCATRPGDPLIGRSFVKVHTLYDQEMSQSQANEQPTATRGRLTELYQPRHSNKQLK